MTYLEAAKHADDAASHADSAVRLMNEPHRNDPRDRAFEEFGFAVFALSKAIAQLARASHRAS
ncbi:hypothetical protein [Agromyces sp. Soil535]|uniref:hypothetical protein n=1 Tax=Agromyces sp. Soil535 TaxID=1736390 RepID=UPI0006F9B2A5|nr:hypothetical protein [Agromyces sp. Soil535]KRE30438.1 hypothetical protein ASG80_16925 [Agromyces sp. Soil535]